MGDAAQKVPAKPEELDVVDAVPSDLGNRARDLDELSHVQMHRQDLTNQISVALTLFLVATVLSAFMLWAIVVYAQEHNEKALATVIVFFIIFVLSAIAMATWTCVLRRRLSYL